MVRATGDEIAELIRDLSSAEGSLSRRLRGCRELNKETDKMKMIINDLSTHFSDLCKPIPPKNASTAPSFKFSLTLKERRLDILEDGRQAEATGGAKGMALL